MNKTKKADAETRKAELLKMSASERRIDAFMRGYERGFEAGRLEQSRLDSPYITFYQMHQKKKEKPKNEPPKRTKI